MRVIHTSDWHLGRTLHGASLMADHSHFLDWLRTLCVDRQADLLVVSGDVYDRAVPPVEAVALLDRTLTGLAAARVPVLLVSGNHDSAVRLGFASGLSEAAGVHLRTTLADIDRPVVLTDEHGQVGCYGVPYLLPDAVMEQLGTTRSHEAVLAAAAARVRADAAARGLTRTVVAAHAFLTGGEPSESERDIRVGGIGDAPAAVFDGVSYLALGHLHGPQQVTAGVTTTARYSGSPLAYSFSEATHTKSVAVVELDAHGVAQVELVPVPVPRPLRQVRGTVDELLALADADPSLAGCWIKAVITDRARPVAPMERLRAVWPHTLVLEFAPEGRLVDHDTDLARLRAVADPVEVCALFVEYVGGDEPDDFTRAVLREAVESVQVREIGA